MLSKNFKSNKFYEVTRYFFKYGNEWDELDATTTVWDTYEKAIAYIERYSVGLKFASAFIEEMTVNKEITADDYKHNNFKYISSQKIYDVTADCVEDFTKEEIYYFKKSEQADETVEEKTEPIKEEEPEESNEDEGVSIVPKFEVCVDGKPVTSTETIEGANIIKKALVAEARKHKARDKPPDKFKSIGA